MAISPETLYFFEMPILTQRISKQVALMLIGSVLATHPGAVKASQPSLSSASALHVIISPLFSDHVVLQRNRQVPVWGTADPNSGVVEVSIDGQVASAAVDAIGRWRAVLPPLKAGGPYDLVVSSVERLLVHDVLIGDVFLASGQSNMSYPLAQEINPPNLSPDDAIRFFVVPPGKHDVAIVAKHASWEPQKPIDMHVSAVAYYFAQAVRQHTHDPVGIIEAAEGGTNAETWTSSEALANYPDLVRDASNQAHLKNGTDRLLPGHCFRTMIAPIVPYAIESVLWYQGEENTWPALHAQHYRQLLSVLIEDWRKRWGYDIPFNVVQLPNIGRGEDPNVTSSLVDVREAQQKISDTLPMIRLVVTIDTGDGGMHPPDKWDIGWRLALSVIDQKQGPIFDHVARDSGRLRIFFRGTVNGLRTPAGPLNGFWIAAQDKRFVQAVAVIDGSTVLVSSPSVSSPVAVRYAWSDAPQKLNLYDGAGLPAAPFRTDDW